MSLGVALSLLVVGYIAGFLSFAALDAFARQKAQP